MPTFVLHYTNVEYAVGVLQSFCTLLHNRRFTSHSTALNYMAMLYGKGCI